MRSQTWCRVCDRRKAKCYEHPTAWRIDREAVALLEAHEPNLSCSQRVGLVTGCACGVDFLTVLAARKGEGLVVDR
jgi:hypothetical protein